MRSNILDTQEIGKVIDFLTTAKQIISLSETDGVTTVTVNDTLLLDDPYRHLLDGMYVKLGNINYQVSNVVENVSFDVEATGIDATEYSLAFEYRYGSRIEVNKLLGIASQKPEENRSRFPLLWLIVDADNSRDFNLDNPVYFEKLTKFSMINLTKVEYNTQERETNNFIPTLQPYVTLFLDAIRSTYFREVFFFENKNFTDYKDWYRYFYGSADKGVQVFDATTDAIEFELRLQYKNRYCEIDDPQIFTYGLGAFYLFE